MIVLMSVSIIVWPLLGVFLVGPKKFMGTLILTFVSLFITLNIVSSLYASVTSVALILTINILASFIYMTYLLFKRDRVRKLESVSLFKQIATFFVIKKEVINRTLLKKRLRWISTFLVMIIVATLFRIFINHMNSDTIFYSWISQQLANGDFLNTDIDFYYRIPTFYQIATLTGDYSNYHTIFGEISQLTLCIFVVNYLLHQQKPQNTLLLFVYSILLGITVVYGVSFRTSSVNWSAGAITMLFILANHKNLKLLFLTPLTFANFSFSALLFFPICILFFFFRRKTTFKEIVFVSSISFSIIVLVLFSLFNVNYKFFLITIPLVFCNIFIYFTKKLPDKELENFIYKIRIPFLEKFKTNKNYKKIIFWSILIFLTFTEIIMILMFSKIIDFPLIMNPKVGTILITVPVILLILFSYWIDTDKFPAELQISLFMTATMLGYFILQLIPNVPYYLADRISLPFTAITPILGLICLIRWIEEKSVFKIKKMKFGGLLLATGTSTLMMWGNTTPAVFWSPFTTNFEENYKFVKNSEKQAIDKILDDKDKKSVIYSDVALASIKDIDENKLYFTYKQRNLFYSAMKERMTGFEEKYMRQIKNYYILLSKYDYDKKNKDFIEEYNKALEKKEISKKIDPYLGLANSIDILNMDENWWNLWDKTNTSKTSKKKVNVFAFREKEYAKIVTAHYKNTHIEEIHGMYIVRLPQ